MPKALPTMGRERCIHAAGVAAQYPVPHTRATTPTGPADAALVRAIYDYFSNDPYAFEACAIDLWKMQAKEAVTFVATRRSSDGGRDAYGWYFLGPGKDRIRLEWSLEAKLYAPGNGANVKETSRLISRTASPRIRRVRYHVLPTKQAYEELRGDRHPVVVICGRDVAGVCYDSTATRRFPKYFLARDQVPAAACPLMTNRVMTATGRNYARIYERVQRKDAHEFVAAAVEAAGGRVLLSSGPSTAPLFLSIEDPAGARIGLSAYVFSANRVTTKHRPTDEHRAQVRYGNVNDRAWRLQAHPLGWDPADLDVRLLLVVHRDAGLLISLDPLAYDPLPLGEQRLFQGF